MSIKSHTFHNKDGYLFWDDERKKGIFAYRTKGSTKTKRQYDYIRLYDVGETKKRPKKEPKLYWRRRHVTEYDTSHGNTVTNHINLLTDRIPDIIALLTAVYESETGEKLAGEHKKLEKKLTEKQKRKQEETELIKELSSN